MSCLNGASGACFIHVPKTAGTSMESLGFVGGTSHATIYDYLLDQEDLCLRSFKWGFVRNPYDRLVSSWRHAQVRHSGLFPAGATTLPSLVHSLEGVLPFLPANIREIRYREYYTEELADAVLSLYWRDFTLFGYEGAL